MRRKEQSDHVLNCDFSREGNMAFLNPLHIEADRWDGAGVAGLAQSRTSITTRFERRQTHSMVNSPPYPNSSVRSRHRMHTMLHGRIPETDGTHR